MIREAATLLLLAAVALAVARNVRQWLAAFVIAFGVWDLLFYCFLKVLLDWPASLWTWDLLFLLPVPWVAPVLAPMLAALTMIGAGLIVLYRERADRPIPFRAAHWLAIFGGGFLQVAAFCWDFRNTAAGGEPAAFHWPLFFVGGLIGLGGFFHAVCHRCQARDFGENAAPEPISAPGKTLQDAPDVATRCGTKNEQQANR